jgi:phage baseplate assembly protein V
MIDRLLNLIGIGRVTLADDDGDVQLLQLTERAEGGDIGDRIIEKVRRACEFGFSSVPPLESDAVVVRMGGLRTQSIVVATGHKDSRPRGLKPGDVVIYDVRGRMVRLTEDGIEIDAAGGEITVTNASKIRADCDIETTGDVISRADGQSVSLNALHDAYNQHAHPPVAGGTTWGVGPPNLQA